MSANGRWLMPFPPAFLSQVASITSPIALSSVPPFTPAGDESRRWFGLAIFDGVFPPCAFAALLVDSGVLAVVSGVCIFGLRDRVRMGVLCIPSAALKVPLANCLSHQIGEENSRRHRSPCPILSSRREVYLPR